MLVPACLLVHSQSIAEENLVSLGKFSLLRKKTLLKRQVKNDGYASLASKFIPHKNHEFYANVLIEKISFKYAPTIFT